MFDPFFLFVAVIAISLGYSKKYIVPLTALFIGLLAETLATEVNQARQWGESIHVFLGAGIIQLSFTTPIRNKPIRKKCLKFG
ncbi:hypothetical protein [Endozoicomonas atrinae]|uniref:hypothetical protein n=1 Tax=Endozoicomonas atrinae TaxID=1333660 RepID=UPI003B0031BF